MNFKLFYLVASVSILTSCENYTLSKIDSVTHNKLKVLSNINVIASSSIWPITNLIDNDSLSCWSSNIQPTSNAVEYVILNFESTSINYIQMMPRYISGNAVGFPTAFKIYYKSGNSWILNSTYTAFPNPYSDWIILPFTSSVVTAGIKIETTKLSVDNVGNYVFQLGGITAGFNSDYSIINFVGNNGISLQNEIRNVGSGIFDPNKLSNWNFDYRSPLLAPNAGNNIYAPNIVYNNGAWNIYYGGWDYVAVHDQVSITVSLDSFLTFGARYIQIANGVFHHVNNENVIKKPDGTWLMYYTTLPSPTSNINKPGYATSTNGVSWSPNAGNNNFLLSMNGYINWTGANLNGSNVLYFENGVYHLYFTDFSVPVIHHATSSNGINYTYNGIALNETEIAQDLKMFNYNGVKYYLLAMHLNDNFVRLSMGTDLNTFTASQILTSNVGAADRYITSTGFVSDGTRLYGILYGAGSVTSLDKNRIFAKWLQKKVIFISGDGLTRWGDIERAYGPDRIKLFMSKELLTGHFYIYDTDGSTLLFTSPLVTIRSGDIWQYNLK